MQSTTQYKDFIFIDGNAPIKQSHVYALAESIKKDNLLHARPILVNERMEVIDGQHRLRAAEMLNIPIFYIQVEGLHLKDIAAINSNQRNWKLDYFLNLYADHLKNAEYIKLKEWIASNEFTLNQAISFFIEESDVLKFRNEFKGGDFKFSDQKSSMADKYKVFINKAESLTKGIMRPWKQQSFIRAFIMFFSNPEIDEKRFFEQVEKFPFLISFRPTKQQILEMLYEVYNYRRHTRVDFNS